MYVCMCMCVCSAGFGVNHADVLFPSFSAFSHRLFFSFLGLVGVRVVCVELILIDDAGPLVSNPVCLFAWVRVCGGTLTWPGASFSEVPFSRYRT